MSQVKLENWRRMRGSTVRIRTPINFGVESSYPTHLITLRHGGRHLMITITMQIDLLVKLLRFYPSSFANGENIFSKSLNF
jgi:hypothetical protein